MDINEATKLLILATEQDREENALLITQAALQLGANFNDEYILTKDNALTSQLMANSNDKYSTVLHVMTSKNWLTVCQLLMDNGAKLLNNYNHYTPLDLAAAHGHTELIPILYRKKIDHEIDAELLHPHHIAAMYGHAATLRALCTIEHHHLCCTTFHYEYHYPLTLAIKYSNKKFRQEHLVYPTDDYTETIKTILEFHGPPIGRHDAMETAATYDVVEAANIMYEKSYYKNLNERNHCNSDTLLHIAARRGSFNMVRWLLSKGADKSIKNCFGQIPYDEAVGDRIKKLLYILPVEEKPVVDANQKEFIHKMIREL